LKRLRHSSPARLIAKATIAAWIVAAAFQAAAASTNFEFVVIGDTRPRFESESFREFERLIPKINAIKPALVINLGDLIYGYGPIPKERQWEKYDRVARTVESPHFQVPGNHDTHSREARRIYARLKREQGIE